MQIYLVGGAVRDALLGRKVTERDYVVVGATEQQMLAKGYTQVGKDFPVFLHPKTSEEYALARTERKKGTGYTGFECNTSTSVTLEEDLKRRDLTVNAIAQAADGTLIDPYNGQQDLQNRLLRHVSVAFSEDPLRVFRVARFAARYAYLGFSIADETLALMNKVANSGELNALSGERVWQETKRSLLENNPEVFFKTLKAVNGLQPWFCELNASETKYQAAIQALIKASEKNIIPTIQPQDLLTIRFSCLCAGLAQQEVADLCARLKVPNAITDIAMMVTKHKDVLLSSQAFNASTLLNTLNDTDAFRRPERFNLMLSALTPITNASVAEWSGAVKTIKQALDTANTVNVQDIIKRGCKGPEIRNALNQARLEQIASTLKK